MRIPNHAPGFAGQWGYPQWVDATDMSESFWVDVADEDVSYDSDPLLILLAEEAQP
jgi:hypothetical protein